MTPVLDEWTIVLAGSWNTAILNPEWLGPNVLETAELEIEMLIGPARPQIKIVAPLVTIASDPTRVVLNARRLVTRVFRALQMLPLGCWRSYPKRQSTALV